MTNPLDPRAQNVERPELLPYMFSCLDCGHAVRIDRMDEPCPFCADYAEAHALDVMADTFYEY